MPNQISEKTPPPESINSCLELLRQRNFIPILTKSDNFTLSHEETLYYLSETSIHIPAMTNVAVCLLSLLSNSFLFEIINNVHLQSSITSEYNNEQLNVMELTRAFFNFDIYYTIANYNPLLLPEFLSFQKQIFFIGLFPSMNHIQLRFKYNLLPETETNLETINLTIFYYLEFLKFSHPRNFDSTQLPHFTSRYFYLLTISAIHIPEPLRETYYNLALESIESHSDILYSSICALLSNSNFAILYTSSPIKQFLSYIFINPSLCSIALKMNNTDLLPYCNVEKNMREHPEFFF